MAEEVKRRPYVRPVTSEWIFRHPRYIRYMVREFSCLFIGAWTLLMVWGLKQLAQGPQAWAAFLEHSVTWFNLTPKALPVQRGEAFVPDGAISGAHFAVWAVLSLAVLFLAGAF